MQEIISNDRPLLPLAWETGNNIGRTEWTDALWTSVYDAIALFKEASDLEIIRTDYATLDDNQLATAICEMFVWIAYFESSWRPQVSVKGVSGSDDKDTYACGLFQMGVTDQVEHNKYDYSELCTAIPNIETAVDIMRRQLHNTKRMYGKSKMFISAKDCEFARATKRPTCLFWSTIHPGGKYDKTSIIAAHTQSMHLQQFSHSFPEQATQLKPPEMETLSPAAAPIPQAGWLPPSIKTSSPRHLQPSLEEAIDKELMIIASADLHAAVLGEAQSDFNTLVALAAAALSSLKVREKTNSNDGTMVELIQKTSGGIRGWAWCMYEQETCVAYAENKKGIVSPLPSTGSCADMRAQVRAHIPSHIMDYKDSKKGDIWIWQHADGSGHTGNFWQWIDPGKSAVMNEGNTTAGKIGDKIVREGGGSYTTERSVVTSAGADMRLVMVVRPFVS